jgi:hypothetical protein
MTSDERRLLFRSGQQPFTLVLLAGEFMCPSYSVFLFPDAPFRGLFIGSAPPQFAKKPLAMHFLFQYPQGLIDVVVAYVDAQFVS